MKMGSSRFVTDDSRSTLTLVTCVGSAVWFAFVIYQAVTQKMAWTPDLISRRVVRLQDDPKAFWLGVAWASAMLVICGLGALWVWASDHGVIDMRRRPR